MVFHNETGDADGDTEFELATSSQFSVTCGCSTTTDISTEIDTDTTITDIVTISTETTTSDTDPSLCEEGQSFTIVSTVVPEVAGCYSDTGLLSYDEVYYSETGTTDFRQNLIIAKDFGEDGTQNVSTVQDERIATNPVTPRRPLSNSTLPLRIVLYQINIDPRGDVTPISCG